MSIQDREWYQEELRRKAQRKSPPKAAAPIEPHAPRYSQESLRDVPGANWHWSIKAIALGWVLVLIFMAIRYIGR